jgi:hypothetical protein
LGRLEDPSACQTGLVEEAGRIAHEANLPPPAPVRHRQAP